MQCRVVPLIHTDGPHQMGIDLALLESVSANPTAACIRAYTWTSPTLSLGYFQPLSAAHDDPRWQGVSLVRRLTGGGAILHHHELTYAIALPRAHPLAQHPEPLYEATHAAISALITTQSSLPLTRFGGPRSGPFHARPFLCFVDRDPEDLVAGPHKLVGSAQRRRPGAVLQHGSILLARSPLTPELPGINDLSESPISLESLSTQLPLALAAALALDPFDAPLTPHESTHAAALALDPFQAPAWTAKR